jgi:hypothetical protein
LTCHIRIWNNCSGSGFGSETGLDIFEILPGSVADLDPEDPYVFGFSGLPDPDLLARATDPDRAPDPLFLPLFCDFFMTFYL